MLIRWESPLESAVSIPATFSPSLPSGQGAQQIPEAQGPQAGPARENISAPGDAAQPWAHTGPAALIPSANPVGLGAQLTGGPGSPRGTAPSTNPGGPCREKAQLLSGCPEGSVLPSALRGCSATCTLKGPPSRRAEESRKCRATHPFPSVTLFSLEGQKKQRRAVLGCSHVPRGEHAG